MSSRWANSDDATIEAHKRSQKEEKRRVKEEKQRRAAEIAAKEQREIEEERPGKRQRTASPVKEDGTIFQIPNRMIQSSRGLDAYEILNNIEEGSYGLVSRARDKTTGNIVAVKRLKVDKNFEGFLVTGLREIQTLRACSHQHIVALREVVVGPQPAQDVYLVMDFLEHDLKDLLQDMDEPFSPSEIKTLMLQMCSAIQYLHQNWIIHRDLKTSNLLLNNRGELKLADFGMARRTANPPPKLTQLVVTLWYRAPELLLGVEKYGFEIDMWSAGCIFSELLTCDPLFQGNNEVTQLAAIFDLLGMPGNREWPNFRSLPNSKALLAAENKFSSMSKLSKAKYPAITGMGLELLAALLSLNPANRLSASQILAHPYFEENPRPKSKEMFPTFPSRAGQEKRRRKVTPHAPIRSDAPRLELEEFAGMLCGSSNSL